VSWTNGSDNVGDLQQYAEDLVSGVTNSLTNGSVTNDSLGGSNAAKRMQQQDALAVAQNGGLTDDSDLDNDTDDGMDDDMMDKISSSPSIEDGGYSPECNPRPRWPQRVDSLPSLASSGSTSSITTSEARPSPLSHLSPQKIAPQPKPQQTANVSAATGHRHLHGGYSEDSVESRGDAAANDSPKGSDSHERPQAVGGVSPVTTIERPRSRKGTEVNALKKDRGNYPRKDEAVCGLEDERAGTLTVPYDPSVEDDDDSAISFPDDPRYLGSGWGYDCLQLILEDIDFEFVYALHTFVATVEGQANATKGDTMVLLDDSNSYWWLVRVVKDSSIGTAHGHWHLSRHMLTAFRISTCRTYRNTDREISTIK
jgi:hypothetical protein